MAEVLPIRPKAPAHRVTIPPTPTGLSAASRRLWREINREWEIDIASRPLLAAALESLDRYRVAAARIRADGPVVTGGDGALKSHPCHAMLRDNLTQARQIFRQLNLALDPPVG